MQRWFCGVLLVLCGAALTWSAPKADDADDAEWLSHLCTYYSLLDDNCDGRATFLDFGAEWTRIPLTQGDAGKLVTDVKRQLEIAAQAFKLFPLTDKNLLVSAATGGVSLQEFTAYMKKERYSTDLEHQIGALVAYLHSILSYDADDQRLTPNEWKIIWNVLNMDTSKFDDSFRSLDADGDGFVSLDEHKEAVMAYFNAADPTDRNRYWIGPLKTCAEVAARKCSYKIGLPIDIQIIALNILKSVLG